MIGVWARYPNGRCLHFVRPGDLVPACGGRSAHHPDQWEPVDDRRRLWRHWPDCRTCAAVHRVDQAHRVDLEQQRATVARLAIEHLAAHDWPMPACVQTCVDIWLEVSTEIAVFDIERGRA